MTLTICDIILAISCGLPVPAGVVVVVPDDGVVVVDVLLAGVAGIPGNPPIL